MDEKKKRRVLNAGFQEMRRLAAMVASSPFENLDEKASTSSLKFEDGGASSMKKETSEQNAGPASSKIFDQTADGDPVSSKEEAASDRIPVDQTAAAAGDPASSKEDGVGFSKRGDAESSKICDETHKKDHEPVDDQNQMKEDGDEPVSQEQRQEQVDESESSSSDEDDGFEDGSDEGGEDDENEDDENEDDDSDEAPVTDDDVSRLVDWLMEVESEAAEAQEALEEESLNKMAEEVKAELAQKHSGTELELAVKREMDAYTATWQSHLSELEEESSKLQERVEDAGVSLSQLYKMIERQAPDGCVTEAWKKRTHWAGTQASTDVVQVLVSAEEDLERQRPVMRRRGKLVEEGASGFLESKGKSMSSDEQNTSVGWNLLDELVEPKRSAGQPPSLFNTKSWASVYSASTPEQASRLGLNFPGVNKVEEIADIDENLGLEATALAEESAFGLTERQKKKLKRVREVDDLREMHKKPGRRRAKDNVDMKTVPGSGTTAREQFPQNETCSVIRPASVSDGQVVPDATDPGCLETDMDTEPDGPNLSAEKTNNSSHAVEQDGPLVEDFKASPCEKNQTNVTKDEKVLSNKEVTEDTTDGQGNKTFEDREVKKPSENHGLASTKKPSEVLPEKAVPELIILSDDDEDIPSAECASNAQSVKININEEDPDDTTSPLKFPKRILEQGACPSKKRRKLVHDWSDEEDDRPPLKKHKKVVAECDDLGAEGPTDHKRKDASTAKDPTGNGESLLGVCEVSSGDEKDCTSTKTEPKYTEASCTICSKSLACRDAVAHPVLPVVVCKSCKRTYESTPFSKDGDTDAECKWCGEGGDMLCCDFCERVFCENCINRNIGPGTVQSIEMFESWKCFVCDPSPLKELSQRLEEAEQGKQHAGPDIDSGNKELNFSSRSKSRKNIRRVIPDDELDEKTKKLLEIEKERRERLKKWYEAAAGKGKSRYETSRRHATNPDDSIHLCEGDCKALGCVINIADRESNEPLIRIPASISRCLKPHQLEGVRFMWENCVESVSKVKSGFKGLGCILAHCMGLGKTLQVIAFLYTVMRAVDFKTALIVVPVNVLHNWKFELTKWQPEEVKPLSVYMLDDVFRNNATRAHHLCNWKEKGGVMLIGYTSFRTLCIGKSVKDLETRTLFRECLQNPGPDLLVCDEAHTIKNKKADITQELQQVRTSRRIAMTGSPLQNNLMEYYCMVNFVREGFLGGVADFRNRYQNPIANGQHADSTKADVTKMKQRAHVLHTRLEGFVQRRGIDVLKNEIPPKCVWVISVRLSALQKELYRKYLSFCGERSSLLFENYHSLAKIWNHPDVLLLAKEAKDAQQFVVDSDKENEAEESASGAQKRKAEIPEGNFEWCQELLNTSQRHVLENGPKLLLVLRLLDMTSSQGDKMLIFSQSLSTLDLLEHFLGKTPRSAGFGFWTRGREWFRLDGTTNAMKRLQITDEFNDPENTDVKCVLISTRAGSLGINLTGACRVIIIDGSWNPTHDLQALFRAWRLGQTKPVYVYRLLAYGTMEEKIYHRQLAKEGIAARVLDAHQVGRHLNADDLDLLYTFDDDDDDVVEDEQAAGAEAESSSKPRKQKHKSFCAPSDAPPRDELMALLLLDYRPRWIANYHEHEPLLEDLEDEKLSPEEKLQAWDAFRKEHEPQPNPPAAPQQQTPGSSSFPPQQSSVPGSSSFPPQQSSVPAPCDPGYHARVLQQLSLPVTDIVTCGKCYEKIGWENLKQAGKS